MKGHLKSLFGETAIYGLSSMATKLISIFLIPLYTAVLTPSDYGVLNLVTAFFSLALVLSVFALDNSAARWYYDIDDTKDRKKTISSWFYFQLGFTICLGVIFLLFSSQINDLLFDLESTEIFIIAICSFIAGVLPAITPNWYRMQRNAKATVIYTLTFSLLTIGLTIYFVLYDKLGVYGIFLANFIANTIMSVVSLFILKDWLHFKYFELARLRELIKFAAPLVPTVLAFWVLNSSASFVIEAYHGKNELGLFQIGMSLASGITLIVTAFRMAFPPFAYSIYKQPEAKELFANILTIYSFVMVAFALLFGLFSAELLQVLTQPEYFGAALTACILFFNNIIYGYSNIVGLGIGVMKENKPLAVAVFMGAILTGCLFFFLIPNFGKEGAASSMLIGYLVIPIYVYFASQKKWYIPFKPVISIAFFITGISFMGVYQIYKNQDLMNSLLFRICLFFGFLLFASILLFFYDRRNFNQIKRNLLTVIFKLKN